MIDKNNIHNPWTSNDEKEHIFAGSEWWCAEAFFKTIKDNKRWSLKVALTEGQIKFKKKIESILNMTLFDLDNNKFFICYSRDLTSKLKSIKDRFDVSYNESFMRGAFPNYSIYIRDQKNDIEIDLNFLAEAYPHWIAQDITKGWLPMGLGYFKYGFVPKNKISGTMKIKEKTYSLEGKGYFEHIWGDFDYHNPLSNLLDLKKTIVTYTKLAGWWFHNHRIKIPNSITLSTDNNPFGYDWVWSLLDNGWSLFYGNIMFWIREGPVIGSLILTKDGKSYTEFCDITFSYKKIKYADDYDFYYPTELEITAKNGKEKFHLVFKMTSKSREWINRFVYTNNYWIGLAICEAPGIVEGNYFDSVKKIKLSGICKMEAQRQISKIGHNSLKIDFLLPPKGVGISMDLKSHFFKKKMFICIRLAPSPKIKLDYGRIEESKVHKN